MAGLISFGQDPDLAAIAPAGQREGAHVGGRAHVGGSVHGNDPITIQCDDDVGHGSIGQELAFHGAGTSGERDDADAPQRIVEQGRRAAGGQQASRRGRLGEGDRGDATAGFFGNQREFEEAAAAAADVFGDAHPQGAGGDQVGPKVGVMAQGLGGAHPGRIRFLAEEGGKRLPDELLFLGQREVHASNPLLTAVRFLDAYRVRE